MIPASAEIDVPVKKKLSVIRVMENGVAYLDLTRSKPDLMNAVKEALRSTLGYDEVDRAENVYELDILASCSASIEDSLDNYSISQNRNDTKLVLAYIADHIKSVEARITSKLKKGVIEFCDIPYVFTRGVEAVALHDGELVGGIVDCAELQHSFMGRYYKIQLKVFSNISGNISEHSYTTTVGAWRGQVPINSIPIRLLSEEDKKHLSERGKIFQRYATGPQYVQYKGQLVRSSWWSNTSYRADGRVVIDSSTFEQIDNDQMESESRAARLEVEDRYSRHQGVVAPSITLTEDDFWRTFPFVYGFSFRAKQWGRMAVGGITPINWREDAWDKLVLPTEEKELVRAIVAHQGSSFSDIVDEKGGGTIFLLHGPPGQGKTLTAETIAEVLKRPLYAISVGELGVSPDELEENLRQILDLATVWNAVLLLDEADIFLEARDEKDIVRNAMVGVFLRLLEYHQGVLFLTTNRVRNIDEAFYSRISVALEFEEATPDKRAKVWNNLLEAAGIEGIDPNQLASHDLNGRQVKNIIRLSQTLASSRGGSVTIDDINRMIALTARFKK